MFPRLRAYFIFCQTDKHQLLGEGLHDFNGVDGPEARGASFYTTPTPPNHREARGYRPALDSRFEKARSRPDESSPKESELPQTRETRRATKSPAERRSRRYRLPSTVRGVGTGSQARKREEKQAEAGDSGPANQRREEEVNVADCEIKRNPLRPRRRPGFSRNPAGGKEIERGTTAPGEQSQTVGGTARTLFRGTSWKFRLQTGLRGGKTRGRTLLSSEFKALRRRRRRRRNRLKQDVLK
ncbi:hypothetical protein SKAU_G00086490 [Synaphobranchus kaupii]|uniref:Uncharacterized protein n=1 Tax=Synaphobranchus kaupii TaxID=118154 RepID=A0A9Q1FVU0_SYNKA|nr:hypothetical protein SKAU_G00086490 [Synaphobranchus kaupii]